MVHSVLETTPDSVLHTDQDPLFEVVYSSSVSYFGHTRAHTRWIRLLRSASPDADLVSACC